jgi:hypothetical protein
MSELHTKAIRIHLLWGYWRPEKTDRAITNQTNASLGVSAGRGHYDKDLFSPEYMRGLREHSSKTKAYYYAHTLPWEDRVSRLIASARVEETAIYLNRAIEKYDEILRATVGDDAAYEQAIYDQRVYMGSAWVYGDYPRREAFMARYHGRLDILPLVSSADIRCELNESLRSQIAQSITRDTEERYRLAMADCWKRLYDPVKRMADTLADPKQTFRNSLVENVREICEVMPELNILDDPELKRMTAEVYGRLAFGTDPDDLRDNLYERAEQAKRASELADILSRMGVS